MFTKEELNAEWLKEPGPFGKYYRLVNGMKEYEPTIITSAGEVRLSQYKRMMERKDIKDNE